MDQIDLSSLRNLNQQKSYQWYVAQIRKLGLNTLTPNNALKSGIGTLTTRIQIGKMYLFLYDPKFKEQLPYYDRFPLVMPFNVMPGGFMGLNFHYIPPLARMRLLNNLLEYASDYEDLSDTTKIRATWSVLSNYSKFPGAQVCVKRYLFNHVRSRFLQIAPADWQTSIYLPLEAWEKQGKSTVYRDFRDIANA